MEQAQQVTKDLAIDETSESREELATRASEDVQFYIEGRNDVARNNQTTLAAMGYIAYWQSVGA